MPDKIYVDADGNPIAARVRVDADGNPIVAPYTPDDAMMRATIERAQGVQPYSDDPAAAPKPSALMGALSHVAHPKSVSDLLPLVAPEVGMESWVPGVRMAKTALRFAREEPHAPGAIGSITGAVRGALRGAYREAFGKGAVEESPRLVKAGTDTPVALPIGRARAPKAYIAPQDEAATRDTIEAGMAKAIDAAPGAKDRLPDLDKAIATAKKEADDARGLSGRREERMTRAEMAADLQDAKQAAQGDDAELLKQLGDPEAVARVKETIGAPPTRTVNRPIRITGQDAPQVASPPIHVDPASVAAVGGEMTPMEEAAIARRLGIAPGVKFTLNEKGQAARDELKALRAQEGASRTALKLGMTPKEVREIAGGPAGQAPLRMQQDFTRTLDALPDKAARIKWLQMAPKNENATAYNWRTRLLEEELRRP